MDGKSEPIPDDILAKAREAHDAYVAEMHRRYAPNVRDTKEIMIDLFARALAAERERATLAERERAAQISGKSVFAMRSHEAADTIDALVAALEEARVLVGLLTVRQVIEAGDEAIMASGLNPWCMNEGRADGSERISTWSFDAALARVKQ